MAYHRAENIRVFEVASAIFWDHERPNVAMGKISSLFSYSGDTTGDPNIHQHIFGRLWAPSSINLPVTFSP